MRFTDIGEEKYDLKNNDDVFLILHSLRAKEVRQTFRTKKYYTYLAKLQFQS